MYYSDQQEDRASLINASSGTKWHDVKGSRAMATSFGDDVRDVFPWCCYSGEENGVAVGIPAAMTR